MDETPRSDNSARRQHILHSAIIVLVATASFGIGRLGSVQTVKTPVAIDYFSEASPAAAVAAPALSPQDEQLPEATASSGTVVASKNGSKYHYPWCSGAKAITEANKIQFASIEAARAAGYLPAANCKGLK